MQATTFLDGTEPPILLLYGQEDKSVKPSNHERLQSAFVRFGVEFIKMHESQQRVLERFMAEHGAGRGNRF